MQAKMCAQDLRFLELRESFWNQVHPKIGRFRPRYYQKSALWQTISETFIEQPSSTKPNFIDWVRGTYHVEVVISDGHFEKEGNESGFVVPLKLSLDFTKNIQHCTHWTIDTLAAQTHKPVAYPGIHSGCLLVWCPPNYMPYDGVIWETPIFSPYVQIESEYRNNDRGDYTAISLRSKPKSRDKDLFLQASYFENMYLGTSDSCYVVVLQEVLKDLAKLLVFGPRYSDMIQAPVVQFANMSHNVRSELTAEFFESLRFSEAAQFFSRAYCQSGQSKEDEEEKVPSSLYLMSIKTIETLFDHYKIVREPPWIKTSKSDWVDDLGEEALALQSMADWRKFEAKWATITSYACGLNLHEGPWAGEDWRMYIDAKYD